MKKHRLLLTILLILLLLVGGLIYRNDNIRVLNSMENPACTGLQVRSAPFLFVDTQRQFQAGDEMKVVETLIWASVIWTIRSNDRLIVIQLPDILRDLIKPAAEETFLKLAV